MIVTEHWKSEPDDHDYPAAHDYLSLVVPEPVAKHLVDTLKDALWTTARPRTCCGPATSRS